MYTQLRIKKEYRDKLRKLAKAENRSLANMMEVLIDKEEAEMQLRFERNEVRTHNEQQRLV